MQQWHQSQAKESACSLLQSCFDTKELCSKCKCFRDFTRSNLKATLPKRKNLTDPGNSERLIAISRHCCRNPRDELLWQNNEVPSKAVRPLSTSCKRKQTNLKQPHWHAGAAASSTWGFVVVSATRAGFFVCDLFMVVALPCFAHVYPQCKCISWGCAEVMTLTSHAQ